MNKFLIFLFSIILSTKAISDEKQIELKKQLSSLKEQTVNLHDELLINGNELNKINIKISLNKQNQFILKNYIKNNEEVAGSLVYLMQEQIYVSDFNNLIKSLYNKRLDFLTKKILQNYFLEETKGSLNNYFSGLEKIKTLEKDLDVQQAEFKKKKRNINLKLSSLENKILKVGLIQKKLLTNHQAVEQKKIKKKARNLDDLVNGVSIGSNKSAPRSSKKIVMPVQGRIVSYFGEGKDLNKSKNGLVFDILNDSFVTSPINGIVVFAGKFRSYGNLVIVENENNFHCIISGMNIILASSGSEVLKGEPIARVTGNSNNQIYFELRHRGKTIDPKSEVEIL